MSIGRNKPCPCGSGKKFKRCCIDRTGPAPLQPAPIRPSRKRQVKARAKRVIAGEYIPNATNVNFAKSSAFQAWSKYGAD